MNKVKIEKSILNGTVEAPPSKSAAHRALICSFLAGGGSVKPIINSNDMKATVGVINAIKNNEKVLNCLESGSTLRFMIPLAAALGREVTFVGEGRLPQRPIGEYLDILPKHNVKTESNGCLPLKISGKLTNGSYSVNGNVSSQYVTGLLLALSRVDGDSAIVLNNPLQSKPYVDMTVKVMSDFGVDVTETDFGYLIHGNQKYNPVNYTVEGDWSQAAFFLVAGALGGDVTVTGLDINSVQGDRAIVDIIKAFGGKIEVTDNSARCYGGELKGTVIDCTDIPDLVPITAVLAAFSDGKTVIKGAERLRYKESDRIKSIVTDLKLIGADAAQTSDGIIISGGKGLKSAELKGFNDHRILMAFSVAGLYIDGGVLIDDAESINKSYPSFFNDYNMLGGKAYVI